MDVNHRLKFEIDKTILTCNKSERIKELSITYERTDGPTLIVKSFVFKKKGGITFMCIRYIPTLNSFQMINLRIKL